MHDVGDAAAIAAHQRREIADARRDDRLDPFAQAPRQHRRMAAGADRNHHFAAIDDRWKHEGGQVGAVDHIHGNAGVAGARRNLLVALVAGRADHRDRAGEARGQRIVEIDFELSRSGGSLHDLVGNVGVAGIPAHGGMRGAQQAQLGGGVLAAADQRHGAAGHIQENREKAHCQNVLETSRL